MVRISCPWQEDCVQRLRKGLDLVSDEEWTAYAESNQSQTCEIMILYCWRMSQWMQPSPSPLSGPPSPLSSTFAHPDP